MPDQVLLPPTSDPAFVYGGQVNIADIRSVGKFTNRNEINRTQETPFANVTDDSLPNFAAQPGLGEHTLVTVQEGPTYYMISFTSNTGNAAVEWAFTTAEARDGYYNGVVAEIGVEVEQAS